MIEKYIDMILRFKVIIILCDLLLENIRIMILEIVIDMVKRELYIFIMNIMWSKCVYEDLKVKNFIKNLMVFCGYREIWVNKKFNYFYGYLDMIYFC